MTRTTDYGTLRTLDARDSADSFAQAMLEAAQARVAKQAAPKAQVAAFAFAGLTMGALVFAALAFAGVL